MTFVIIHEKVMQSWLKDIGSALVLASLIMVGWLLDSSAMQWAGAIVGFVVLIGRTSSRSVRCTPQEAADKLLRDYGVSAK